MTAISMFVYGTLMHKSHCSGWGEEAEIAPPRDATAKGKLLDYGPFPYADLEAEGIIHGQVLTVDDDTVEFAYIWRVEIGAGYVPTEILVKCEDGNTLECLAWHASHQIRAYNLPVIESGDWNAHVVASGVAALG